MHKGWAPRKAGFTIVELLIVVAVLGILVTIVIVAYNGVAKSAATRNVQNDLTNAGAEMERLAQASGGSYPTTLPSTVVASSGNTFTLKPVSTLPYYANPDPVQNGVLLAQICQDLVNAGLGNGLNAGGGTDAYVTGCGNWNAGSMQVTGWTSQVFNTPILDSTFTNYANAIPAGDNYHPNEQSVMQNFYHQLHDRLIAEGGSFPITTFWDSWATPTNGGVQAQSLPTPTTPPNNTYCLQMTTTAYPDVIWHIDQTQKLMQGSC